jgi:hypothetical protein
VTGVLAAIALALFARLTLRHVGESYFLADQVDQLQKFEALFRLEPEGLWGPVMSGTSAHALGPFGAFVFGLPVALGFGIDAVHTFTSLLLVMATAIVFWQLARLDAVLAWVWLIVFTAMQMVWWSGAMFWVNTLLLPLGLLLLAVFTAMARRPTSRPERAASSTWVNIARVFLNCVRPSAMAYGTRPTATIAPIASAVPRRRPPALRGAEPVIRAPAGTASSRQNTAVATASTGMPTVATRCI